jgi:hypothetical protein
MHKLFESQLEGEKVYLVIREHLVLPAFRLLFIGSLAVLGGMTQVFVPKLIPGIFNTIGQNIFTLLIFAYYLALLTGALLVIVFYYLSLQIITEMRMVDVDQSSLFGRKVTEIQIENVEEATSHATGFLATIFNYGDVLVQTSGSIAEFEFNSVAHPEQVKKLIMDLYEQRRKAMPLSGPKTAPND